ncbi:MAG: IS3 family transposase [Succinivibrionaceae bacterium]
MVFTTKQIRTALELYDKIKNVTSTIRQLGYPSRQTLYEWINQRESTGGKFPDIKPTGVKKISSYTRFNFEGFSAKQKLKILKRCFEGTENIRDVAIDEGVSRTLIYAWRKKYLKYGVLGLQQKKKRIKRIDSIEEQNNAVSIENIEKSITASEYSNEIAKLQKQVKELQMKVDVMSEAFEILKKDLGTDYKYLNNKEKYFIISALKNKYSILSLLDHLSMSKGSYYYVEKALHKDDKYKAIRPLLKDTFSKNYECYGYRRLHTSLKNIGYTVSEKIVRRLMKEEGIKVIKSKRKRYSSYLGEISPAVENIVNRDFSSSTPNEKWLTDISEFATSKGKLYLSIIRDCYNDEIIAYKIGKKPNAALANDTLSEAIKRLCTKSGKTIIHSDRGCHYRWPGWIQISTKNGLIRSMSRKGCSPDNSACEGFFGRMKTECFYNHSLNDLTLDELKTYLNNYIKWYNNDRIKNSLNGLSPVQYRLRNF